MNKTFGDFLILAVFWLFSLSTGAQEESKGTANQGFLDFVRQHRSRPVYSKHQKKAFSNSNVARQLIGKLSLGPAETDKYSIADIKFSFRRERVDDRINNLGSSFLRNSTEISKVSAISDTIATSLMESVGRLKPSEFAKKYDASEINRFFAPISGELGSIHLSSGETSSCMFVRETMSIKEIMVLENEWGSSEKESFLQNFEDLGLSKTDYCPALRGEDSDEGVSIVSLINAVVGPELSLDEQPMNTSEPVKTRDLKDPNLIAVPNSALEMALSTDGACSQDVLSSHVLATLETLVGAYENKEPNSKPRTISNTTLGLNDEKCLVQAVYNGQLGELTSAKLSSQAYKEQLRARLKKNFNQKASR